MTQTDGGEAVATPQQGKAKTVAKHSRSAAWRAAHRGTVSRCSHRLSARACQGVRPCPHMSGSSASILAVRALTACGFCRPRKCTRVEPSATSR